MTKIQNLNDKELTRVLTYAGLILVAFELVKSLIIKPIKFFYADTTFIGDILFKSYEEDVLSRHKNEFEACLLYLRDFYKIIDSDDVLAIQQLREHRNEIAHNLPEKLKTLNVDSYAPLLERTTKALFKLSNHNVIVEIRADPEFQNKGIDWSNVVGEEYIILEDILKKIKISNSK